MISLKYDVNLTVVCTCKVVLSDLKNEKKNQLHFTFCKCKTPFLFKNDLIKKICAWVNICYYTNIFSILSKVFLISRFFLCE